MRYFRKLLFTLESIAVSFTLLVCVIFAIGYRASAVMQTAHTFDAVSRQAIEYTDTQVRSALEIAAMLRTTDYLSKYLQEDAASPDRYARLRLYNVLAGLGNLGAAPRRGIALSKITDDYAMMNDATGPLSFMLDRFGISQTALDNALEGYQNRFSRTLTLIHTDNRPGIQSYILLIRQWAGRIKPFYLFVSLTEDDLFSLNGPYPASIVIIEDGQELARAGALRDDTIDDALAGHATSLMRLDAPSKISAIQYIYLAAPPRADRTAIILAAASIAAIALSYITMYLLTRRMYSPIADTLSVTGARPEQGDEFEGLRRSFHSMSESLSQYSSTAEREFFFNLLTGLFPGSVSGIVSPASGNKNDTAVWERMRSLRLDIPEGSFLAAVLRYNPMDGAEMENGHIRLLEARRALASAIGGDLYRIVDISLYEQVYLFNQTQPEDLLSQLKSALLSIETEYGVEVTAYTGEPCASLADIHLSYMSASRLAERGEYEQMQVKVAATQATPFNSNTPVHYPLAMEQNLIRAVVQGKPSLLSVTLREILDANKESFARSASPLSLMLTATVNRILDGVKQSSEQVFGDDTIIYLEFRSCVSLDALEGKAIEIFTTISEHLASHTQQSAKQVESRMTAFIDANYHLDIGIFDLAEHVNLSQNYVSALFRNTTGRTFKDYLGELRCRKARELIEANPHIKIRDVAASVGCSPDTLGRLFLRYVEASPSEYQLRMLDRKK